MLQKKAATLCFLGLLALLACCQAQNLAIEEELPCGDHNLACIRSSSQPISEVCYKRDLLCDGNFDCELADDEGNTATPPFVNALDCDGSFGQKNMFRCSDGSAVPLSALCDGYNNCTSGTDETNPLCANKCRLPFYGGCPRSRQCVSAETTINCGDCISGFVEVAESVCLPLITIGWEASSYNTSEDSGTVEVCAKLSSGNITGYSFEIGFSASPISASEGEDYSFSAVNLIFSENQQRQCVVINITDDDVMEPLESFAVQLTAFDENILLDPRQATVNISDNDSDEDESSSTGTRSGKMGRRNKGRRNKGRRNKGRRNKGRSRSQSDSSSTSSRRQSDRSGSSSHSKSDSSSS